MKRNKTNGRCKFTGQFPNCRTRCCFSVALDPLSIAVLGANLVKSYRQAIRQTYPEGSRPALIKLQITINIPRP